MEERFRAGGVPVSDGLKEQIKAALASLEGGLLRCWMPGPLEGHRRPAFKPQAKALSDEDVGHFASERDGPLSIKGWPSIAELAQFSPLGMQLLERMKERVREAPFSEGDEDRARGFNGLAFAGIAAAAERNAALAEAIGDRCVVEAHNVNSGEEVGHLFQALLFAAAAFESEAEWAVWLEGKFTEMSVRLPVGEPSIALSKCLRDLERCAPLTLGMHCRAAAFASLGQ
jgi:hypothetical protein